MKQSRIDKGKAWVVSVDMGYGHQRAAYPLKSFAYGDIINANNYSGIPARDRKIWRSSRRFYEFISRFKRVPLIGEPVFDLYDTLQSIRSFYPRRDLSHPTVQVLQIMSLIEKSQWGRHLIARLSRQPLPLICTFFVPAFMAEYFRYPGDIYCLVTDTDISRAWVPRVPGRSRIRYFAPTLRVADRLRLYGIRPGNIFLTGFPLPPENLGGSDLMVLKHDLIHRLANLDPKRRYYRQYRDTIAKHLGYRSLPRRQSHQLTLSFAVGGAGAQREIAVTILRSLRMKLQRRQMSYTMVAGIHNEVGEYFRNAIRSLGLSRLLGKTIFVIRSNSTYDYFRRFNHALRHTDILWSKPSELSFYTGLGIPLIMTPPIGSQEEFNRKWVDSLGAGADQEDPEYTHEWLFDWLDSGWLAESAMEGYLEAPKYGTFNIKKIVTEKITEVKEFKVPLPY